MSRWTVGWLEARRREIGSVAFARAYRLVCVPEEAAPIRPEWVRFWTEPAAYDQVVVSVDPAVSCKADADRTAVVALGRTATNEVHCLEATARRVSAPDLLHLLDDADRRWRPDVILFEANAAFAGIHDLLLRQARFGPRVKPVVQTRDKASRMHAFSVPVESGAFRLKGVRADQVDPGQQGLFDEMVTFPVSEHDDLADAAATGTAYLLDRPEPRVW
jgi:phage terminase large subunit-like protein